MILVTERMAVCALKYVFHTDQEFLFVMILYRLLLKL